GPDLIIGGGDGREFVDIAGIVTVGDDIIVANRHSPPAIQVFGADGSLLRTIGGDGEGPGEFRTIFAVWTEGDTIAALDTRLFRVSRFDVSGSLLGTDDSRWMLRPNYVPWERFGDGSWLLVQNIADTDGDAPGVTKRRAARVRRDDPGLVEFGWFDDAPRQRVRGEYEPVLFQPRTALYATAGDLFYYAYPDAHVLHVFDTAGAYVRSITRDVRPAPVTGDLLPALLEREADDLRARGHEGIEEELAGRAQPDVLPVLAGRAVTDDAGVIWVADYALPDAAHVRWTLYDRHGSHVGDVDLPPQFRPVRIEPDRLIGVWTDELKVQTVRTYTLASPDVER
ncbi:MAG TPA: 6-bladed beta-propeller, partial [Longimicrobiales bacterium]